MRPEQKNWVFLACALFVALFSVALTFRNVKYRGVIVTGPVVNVTTVQDIMREVGDADEDLQKELPGGNSHRPEVYSKASRMRVLLDQLIAESPEDLTPERIADWDRFTAKSAQAADRLADIAADTATDWSLAAPAYRSLQRSCVDCHRQFRKEDDKGL